MTNIKNFNGSQITFGYVDNSAYATNILTTGINIKQLNEINALIDISLMPRCNIYFMTTKAHLIDPITEMFNKSRIKLIIENGPEYELTTMSEPIIKFGSVTTTVFYVFNMTLLTSNCVP